MKIDFGAPLPVVPKRCLSSWSSARSVATSISRDFTLSRANGEPSKVERGGTRGTRILDVDDRASHQSGVPERHLAPDHFLTSDEPRSSVTEKHHSDIGDLSVRVSERSRDSLFS